MFHCSWYTFLISFMSPWNKFHYSSLVGKMSRLLYKKWTFTSIRPPRVLTLSMILAIHKFPVKSFQIAQNLVTTALKDFQTSIASVLIVVTMLAWNINFWISDPTKIRSFYLSVDILSNVLSFFFYVENTPMIC